MNKQIRAIAEQASDTADYGLECVTDAFLEKFAELIIKDCASICDINGDSYKYSLTPAKARLAGSTSKYCGKLIKHHVGVEE